MQNNLCMYCQDKLEVGKYPVCTSCFAAADQINALIFFLDNSPIHSYRSRRYWLDKLPVNLADKINDL